MLFFIGFMPLVLLRTRLRLAGLVPIAFAFALPAFSDGNKPQLLLISEDGSLVSIIRGDKAALSKRRPPAFVFDQWQRALSIKVKLPPVETENITAQFNGADRFDHLGETRTATARAALAENLKAARDSPGLFICERGEWCVASLTGTGPTVAQIFRPALTGPACDLADIIVSVYRPGFQTCYSGSFLITPSLRRQTGTLQLAVITDTDDPDPAALSASPVSLCEKKQVSVTPAVTTTGRQWNMHRLYNWRRDEYAEPVILPHRLNFVSDSGGSDQRACPEP
nr:hypothetical protein [Marinicella sp. W31]MDC2876931.1 hypothetical protein [Marinicella sp. W31]